MVAKTMSRHDVMREALQNHAGKATHWKPDEDDILEGVLVRYEKSSGGKYEPCEIAVIKDADTGEEVPVFISPVVLRSEFARLRPKPGEFLMIRRLPDSSSTQAKLFRMVVERDETIGEVPTDFGETAESTLDDSF